MAQPNSKATLKEYALRRLGKPVLEINISDDQADDALDYTIEKFQEFHFGGSEKMYMKHQFTAEDLTRFQADIEETGSDTDQAGSTGTVFKQQSNYLQMPDHIRAVNGIFTFQDKGTANMFDMLVWVSLSIMCPVSLNLSPISFKPVFSIFGTRPTEIKAFSALKNSLFPFGCLRIYSTLPSTISIASRMDSL